MIVKSCEAHHNALLKFIYSAAQQAQCDFEIHLKCNVDCFKDYIKHGKTCFFNQLKSNVLFQIISAS